MRDLNGNMYFTALEFASKAHEGQLRKGGNVPYISHPIRVALIVMRYVKHSTLEAHGVTIDEICAAALLHDTLEDCDVTEHDILKTFNPVVLQLVKSVTSDPHEIRSQGKKQYLIDKMLSMSQLELALKLCDRLANVTDTPSVQYLVDTLDTLKVLIGRIPEIEPLAELISEIRIQAQLGISKICKDQLERVY